MLLTELSSNHYRDNHDLYVDDEVSPTYDSRDQHTLIILNEKNIASLVDDKSTAG